MRPYWRGMRLLVYEALVFDAFSYRGEVRRLSLLPLRESPRRISTCECERWLRGWCCCAIICTFVLTEYLRTSKKIRIWKVIMCVFSASSVPPTALCCIFSSSSGRIFFCVFHVFVYSRDMISWVFLFLLQLLTRFHRVVKCRRSHIASADLFPSTFHTKLFRLNEIWIFISFKHKKSESFFLSHDHASARLSGCGAMLSLRGFVCARVYTTRSTLYIK